MSDEREHYEPLEEEAMTRSRHPDYLRALIALVNDMPSVEEDEKIGLRNEFEYYKDRVKAALFEEKGMAEYNQKLRYIRQGGFDTGVFGPTTEEAAGAAREAIAFLFISGYAIGDPYFVEPFTPYFMHEIRKIDQTRPFINPYLRTQHGGLNQLLTFVQGVANQGATLARDGK